VKPPRRRRALLAATGIAAAAAGGAFALWQSRRDATPGAGATPPELWSLRFARPDGGELAMATFRGRPLLVNFWATWCPPCIREMPEIERFARQFAPNGWQVLGVAADQGKPVRDFLERNPVSYSIALAGFEGIALSRQLGNEGGALPFTVALDARGDVAHRHLGETRFELLAAWVEKTRRTP
jgi:thiol-disulfide isomerase/thioredoxin